ncbi:TPA: hypothetical protein U1B96_001289 [Streptococcus suis]|uniref:hypothetical protein n=1 Tax=Streptococcus suis TaxID=1307 RepID=UPI001914F1F7|nr:hypothetical protein [Streptococcus suis]MDW8735488.1 hypothetical protein [Streptococcus suis]HEM3143676.1 hypothetical protein [Streptococcus suis]HEM3183952.1 hypothetical protein [Streptococcus suis]HEM3330639.1 hypothetical protein [Streptococcus suis]HEM3361926.1 hypothetical protein [Streptococcus suis]
MDEQNQFNWVNFYKEFAWKLLDYKDNRAELVEKVKAIYTKTKIHMPTLEKDNHLIDIDPFTIFGLFNKQIKEENRIKILTAIAELFNDIKPGFSTAGFKDYQTNLKNEKFDRLISCIEKLNQAISTEEVLGDSFCIGHSYFCGLSAEVLDQGLLEAIVEYELIPLLKEYWFDEPTKIHDWSSKLRSAIQ